MFNLKLITNLPFIEVIIFNGYNRIVYKKSHSSIAIPYLNTNYTDNKPIERLEEINIPLKKGLYSLRVGIGRANFIIMDKPIRMDKDLTYPIKIVFEDNF